MSEVWLWVLLAVDCRAGIVAGCGGCDFESLTGDSDLLPRVKDLEVVCVGTLSILTGGPGSSSSSSNAPWREDCLEHGDSGSADVATIRFIVAVREALGDILDIDLGRGIAGAEGGIGGATFTGTVCTSILPFSPFRCISR